jgi:hypothetical protein
LNVSKAFLIPSIILFNFRRPFLLVKQNSLLISSFKSLLERFKEDDLKKEFKLDIAIFLSNTCTIKTI